MPKKATVPVFNDEGQQFSIAMMQLAKQERIRRGWSQSQLADAMGVSQTIVSAMERHPERITMERLYLLFRVLNLTLKVKGKRLVNAKV